MSVSYSAEFAYGMQLTDATALPEDWEQDLDGYLYNSLPNTLTTAWGGNPYFAGGANKWHVVLKAGRVKLDPNAGESHFFRVEDLRRIEDDSSVLAPLLEFAAKHPGAFGPHGWHLVTSVG